MKKNTIIELENNNKYIVVDMLEYENKKYFLLSQIFNDTNIDNQFDIFLYSEINSNFNEIEDEVEYNIIKDIFENRLENIRKELIKLDDEIISDIIKLKVVDINNYSYIFEKINGEKITMNIEIFGDIKIEVNDYIFLSKSITKECITVRFGPIYTDNTEIIKLIKGNNSYYLQRYYG